MFALLPDLLPILVLIALGALLGRRGFLQAPAVEGFKKLIASVTLPVLLFTAFSRMTLQSSLYAEAALVFAACGALGLAGVGLSRVLKLPRPATGLLFQGFEAGMLGYALFTTFFGVANIPAFASADLGQVLFVFTVLMAQLLAGEKGTKMRLAEVVGNTLRSPVIWSIGLGLLSSALFPQASGLAWGKGGLLDPTLALVGGATTPLVGLVVGFGLKDGIPALRSCLLVVALRLALTAALGAVLAYVVLPALGLLYSKALMILFLLPPPFVIPVFRTKAEDGPYIASTLSLHTLASLTVIVALVLLT
ncbi:MAG: AEC family transporter [Spirochaetales bacterium]